METVSQRAVVVAGPNGAGKTTFAKEYLKDYSYDYLSADEIADEIGPGRLEDLRIQAGRLFFQRVAAQIDQGRSFLVESSLSGRSFQRIIQRLKEAGYSITIIFVFLRSPEVCVARIQERVRKGGHDVPEADVVRRFYRSITNFWSLYRRRADSWYLVYNSTPHFKQVAFGEGDNIDISDEGLFDLLIKNVGKGVNQ